MIKKRKVVFNGRLLHLEVQERLFPNGNTIRLEVIKHPGAALIVPFLTKDKIVFIKQYRAVIDDYIYELPAGTLDKNEKPIECARREIIEEIGYSAKKITRLGEIVPVPGYSTERIFIFKAEQLVKKEVQPEYDEVITKVVMDKKRVKSLLKNGKLIDAKTISALAMAGWL